MRKQKKDTSEISKPGKAPKPRKEFTPEEIAALVPPVPKPAEETLPVSLPMPPAPTSVSKMSALEAAAKVLGEAGKSLSPKEMIGLMAVKGYWSSPGGKTPANTLSAALMKEISTKGDQSRFTKAGPGRFSLRSKTA